ncbi:MAG TPA: hypothetical protein VJK02_20010 [Anaerolineales bacterium]|nr:hypothetical protein [Anaerolineales bacterium]
MTQTIASKAPPLAAAGEQALLPYPASWIDRLMSSVQRLPLPYGITYAILFVLEVLVLHVLGWIDGTLPLFTFHQLYLLFPLWIWGPLTIMTYLDEVALHALIEFQPLMGKHKTEIPRLQYELTTLPARSVWISALLWAVVFAIVMYVGFPVVVRQYSYGPLAIASAWIFGLFSYAFGSVVYYHTIRQLRLVSRTLAMVERVNLFHLDPVYAFARLTAQTGVSWLLLAAVTLMIFPFELVNVTVVAQYVTQVLFALGAFVLPLWNVHQRLVTEKRRLLAAVSRRQETAIGRLHKALDEDDMSRVKEIDTGLAGLASERNLLSAVPTWPWRAATFSGFVSALVLPIMLFLIQLAIRNWLGF